METIYELDNLLDKGIGFGGSETIYQGGWRVLQGRGLGKNKTIKKLNKRKINKRKNYKRKSYKKLFKKNKFKNHYKYTRKIKLGKLNKTFFN